MPFTADDRQNSVNGHRRADPVVPPARDNVALGSGNSPQDRSPNANGVSTSAQRRAKLDENLFSTDPRRQYAALKELQTSMAIGKARYDRIHNIRWSTRYLVLAELAEKLLKEKRSVGPAPTNAHQEIMTLIRQCERAQRQRLLQALQEDPEIAMPRATFVRWLVSAALAGFLLGGVLAYLLVPDGRPPDSKTAEAYIDTRTGNVISADRDSQGNQAGAAGEGDYEPAFYCWNCRKWLPVKNPQKHAAPVAGPLQALSDRPIVLQPRTR